MTILSIGRPPLGRVAKMVIRQPLRMLFIAIVVVFIIVILVRRNAEIYDENKISKRSYPRRSEVNSEFVTYEFGLLEDGEIVLDRLQMRIDDLNKVKKSVANELIAMSRERAKLLKEKSNLIVRNDRLMLQISKSKFQLKQLELDISANRKRKFEKNCDQYRVAPIVFNPMISVPADLYGFDKKSQNSYQELIDLKSKSDGRYNLDFSPCPLTSDFKFYYRPRPDLVNVSDSTSNLDHQYQIVESILENHSKRTMDSRKACLSIVLLGANVVSYKLHDDDTGNTLVISLSTLKEVSISHKTAIASSNFPEGQFRDRVDIALPATWRSPVEYDSIVGSIPSSSPIERKYLASYFGPGVELDSDNPNNTSSSYTESDTQPLSYRERILQMVHRNSIDDSFLFIYNCGIYSDSQCYEKKDKIIEESTFLIILPSESQSYEAHTSQLLYSSLMKGAIPFIVGDHIRLPFDEVIDWRKAAIIVPTGRLPEIHFIMSSYALVDLYQLKYHGRRIFENNLATAKEIIDTTISILGLERFKYPPSPINNIETITYFPSNELTTSSSNTASNCSSGHDCDELELSSIIENTSAPELLGPKEVPLQSPAYRRNFSLVFNNAYDLWNNPLLSPFKLFPSSTIDPVAPSEFKFISSYANYRPISDGLGGSGEAFSRSLGGDYPNEQFTVIILTYERVEMLLKTLSRLKGTPYINKIIIVWNSVANPPKAELVWPDVGAPIEIVKVSRNSLNNRFIPYDKIETDAILTLDDDTPLRPDEIVLAFRVWRESRDRIVGFPGRYHAWDSGQNSWTYNSNHSCELSMVLTGGAFFHRYYNYIYTYQMPQAIRTIVDRFMNCEDIAMNFLVAHLTRKPPIKVTSRWTFHCANCGSSLSDDDLHFRERHECLNMFASIYGYMPLLSTQHRSDSILFKTRLPHDKQKCFKFV